MDPAGLGRGPAAHPQRHPLLAGHTRVVADLELGRRAGCPAHLLDPVPHRHATPCSAQAWLGLAALILTFAGTDALSSRVMKPGFARLRPSHTASLDGRLHHHTFEDGTIYRGGRFSFVSSHAANTFGIATLAVLLFGAGRWRWLWSGPRP